MTNFDWTDAAKAKLERLWNEGISTAEIARQMGVSKNAAMGKAHRIGLPARPSPIKRTHGNYSKKPRPVRLSAPRVVVEVEAPKSIFVQPRPSRKKCLHITGDRRSGFVYCDAPAEADSIWCGTHRATCAIRTPRQEGVGV